ncbi:hypothetical protein [Bradyrhizobium tunisiense]|uniref:hypothetical protein n=1 Tax=Bradyrhizobium tunisiense TaxID=3278709 RepID=UPI0035DF46CA
MRVSAITCHPTTSRHFALVLGTSAIDSAIPTKLTEATYSVVMSQDAFALVIRLLTSRPAVFNERQTRMDTIELRAGVPSVVAPISRESVPGRFLVRRAINAPIGAEGFICPHLAFTRSCRR